MLSAAAMRRQRREVKKESNVTRFVVFTTISFYVCWLPYAVQCMLAIAGFEAPLTLAAMAVLFAKAGTVFHPILYMSRNRYFSKLMTKTLQIQNITN